MLIDKVYTATINIHDAEDYCVRPEEYVLSHLRRRFMNQNHQGAHIIQILKILRRSDCRIKETDLSGEGYVDVEFLALVMVIGQWDIITGVQIVDMKHQLTVGKATREGGNLIVNVLPKLPKLPGAEEGQLAPVRENQTIAIRVSSIKFAPNQSQVTAVGPLLTRDLSAPAYRVSADLTDDDVLALEPLAARVRALYEARAILIKTRREDVFFFESLLYAYAFHTSRGATELPPQTIESVETAAWIGPGGVSLPAEASAVNLLSLLVEARQGTAKIQGIWSRDLAIYRSSPLAALAAQLPPQWVEPQNISPRAAFAAMLQTIHEFAKAVNEMVEIYSTRKDLDFHKNIWVAMRNLQIPAN